MKDISRMQNFLPAAEPFRWSVLCPPYNGKQKLKTERVFDKVYKLFKTTYKPFESLYAFTKCLVNLLVNQLVSFQYKLSGRSL